MRYHISKNGSPAVCYAKTGNCPLGNDNHFESEAEARKYAYMKNEDKYGVIPTSVESLTQNDISEALKVLNKHGFSDYDKEWLEGMATGEYPSELTKKTYGDSYEEHIQFVFNDEELGILQNFYIKAGLDLPEYVYSD